MRSGKMLTTSFNTHQTKQNHHFWLFEVQLTVLDTQESSVNPYFASA